MPHYVQNTFIYHPISLYGFMYFIMFLLSTIVHYNFYGIIISIWCKIHINFRFQEIRNWVYKDLLSWNNTIQFKETLPYIYHIYIYIYISNVFFVVTRFKGVPRNAALVKPRWGTLFRSVYVVNANPASWWIWIAIEL